MLYWVRYSCTTRHSSDSGEKKHHTGPLLDLIKENIVTALLEKSVENKNFTRCQIKKGDLHKFHRPKVVVASTREVLSVCQSAGLYKNNQAVSS